MHQYEYFQLKQVVLVTVQKPNAILFRVFNTILATHF